MDKETAELIVDKIIDDLNGRRGCGIDSLDDEIQTEIRNSWINIAMAAKPIEKEEIKVINTDYYYCHSDGVSSHPANQYIDWFINNDCKDLIEKSYEDEFPDNGFECELYFLLNDKYYCAEIKCETYWCGDWSVRKNLIDEIEVLNIKDFDIDTNKFQIKFI